MRGGSAVGNLHEETYKCHIDIATCRAAAVRIVSCHVFCETRIAACNVSSCRGSGTSCSNSFSGTSPIHVATKRRAHECRTQAEGAHRDLPVTPGIGFAWLPAFGSAV